jgi:hypothetical protein
VEAIEKQDASRVIDELVQVFRRAPVLDLKDLTFVETTPPPVATSAKKDCCH